MAIEAPSSPQPATRLPNHRSAAVPLALLGVLILALALPRLGNAVLAMDGHQFADGLRGGAIPPVASEIGAAARGLGALPHWLRDADSEATRGYLLARQADITLDAAERRRLLAEALVALDNALATSPGEARWWLHRAWLNQQMGDPTAALRSLRMSLLVGPAEPHLIQSRLSLAGTLLPVMDAETREMVERSVRLAMVVSSDQVIGLMGDPNVAALVRHAGPFPTADDKGDARRPGGSGR